MQDNKRLIIFGIMLLFLLSGCATNALSLEPNINSKQKYIENHRGLSIEIKEAILEGKVIKGMTKDNVRASWGSPTEIEDFSTNSNAWWYEEGGEGWWYKPSFLSLGPIRYIEFKQGVVVEISKQ